MTPGGPAVIYSFDVFDTLVTRRVATPRGVFVHMQRQLEADGQGLPRPLCQAFAHERSLAEHSARIQARESAPDTIGYLPEEIDISDVYRWLAARHGLDEGWIERLIEVEIEAEARFLYGVPEMLARFRALAREGRRILLLSDMYLRRQDLKRLLDGIDPFLLDYATLYLSSEIKLNKASGLMFHHVAEQEGVAPTAIRHIGDNRLSDVRRARECGCEATLFTACHLEAEDLFERNADDLGWQVSAGLFRECRLVLDREPARVGGLYAAAVLLPFVLWILEQARRQGRRRLYFFGRDGQVLLDMAGRLGADDLELRYLHVSRLALHRCASDGFDAFLDWVFASHRAMTIADIAHRITSAPEDLAAVIATRCGLGLAADQPLTPRQMGVVRVLLASGLRAQVLDLTARERERVLAYLEQEGLGTVDDAGVIDVGWSGSIQDSLYAVLHSRTGRSPGVLVGFYLGLQRHTRSESADNVKHSFAFHPSTYWRDPVREIVECFTAADHGSTLGYADRGGRWQPLLNDEGPEVVAWGLSDFRRGLCFFAERILGLLPRDQIIALMPYYFRRLELAVQKPSPLFARQLGAFPYSPDPTGKLMPLAPPLSGVQALVFQLSLAPRRGAVTRWRQGSLMNSHPWVRYLLSSKSSALFSAVKAIHPRGLVELLPHPVVSWAKRTLPSPVIRVYRSLLHR